jgi:hypothetical protein
LSAGRERDLFCFAHRGRGTRRYFGAVLNRTSSPAIAIALGIVVDDLRGVVSGSKSVADDLRLVVERDRERLLRRIAQRAQLGNPRLPCVLIGRQKVRPLPHHIAHRVHDLRAELRPGLCIQVGEWLFCRWIVVRTIIHLIWRGFRVGARLHITLLLRKIVQKIEPLLQPPLGFDRILQLPLQSFSARPFLSQRAVRHRSMLTEIERFFDFGDLGRWIIVRGPKRRYLWFRWDISC